MFEDGSRSAAKFRGYDSHTKRRMVSSTEQTPPVLVRGGSYHAPSSSGVSIYGITEIDQYFDDGFVHTANGYSASKGRRLNTPARWQEVEDKLHELSIDTRRSYSNYDGMTVCFTLPVVGHVLVKEDRREVLQRTWLRWKGKYYDPNWIYTVQGLHLRRLCPVGTDHGLRETIEDMALLTKDEYTENEWTASKKGVRQWKGSGYLELDLGSVCHIRMLVLLGGYPSRQMHFPSIEQRQALDPDDENYLPPGSGYSYDKRHVNTVSPADLAWTTSFDLYFRDLATSKWRLYKAQMDGNKDVVSEKVHHVDILSRYVRILPKTCQLFKQLRVRVYGSSRFFNEPVQVRGKEVQMRQQEVAPEEETVEYTLHSAQVNGFRHDGIESWHRYDHRPAQAKNHVKQKVHNDIRIDRYECDDGL